MIKTNKEVLNIQCIDQLENKEIWIVQEDFSILKLTEKGFKKMNHLTDEHVPILTIRDGVYHERFYDFYIKGNLLYLRTTLVKLNPSNNDLTVYFIGESEFDINDISNLLNLSRTTNRRSFFRKLSENLSKPLSDFLGLISFIDLDYYNFRTIESLSKQCPSLFYIENLTDELPSVTAICAYAIAANRNVDLGPNYFSRLFGTRMIELTKDKHYFYPIISQHHFDFFEILYYEYLTTNQMHLIKSEHFKSEHHDIFKYNRDCLYEQISACVNYEDCLSLSIQRSLENGLAYIYQLPYITYLINDILNKTENDYKLLVSYLNFYDYQPLVKSLSSYLEIKPYFKGEKLSTRDLLLFGQSLTIDNLKAKGYDPKKIEYFLDVLDHDVLKALSLLQDRVPLSNKKQRELENYMMNKNV